jgi:pyruvate carboxylase subunit B
MTNTAETFQNLNIDNEVYKTRLSVKFKNRKRYEPANSRLITSFIPGTVVDILVDEGSRVAKGEELMILDAMKMKIRVKSGTEGTIKKIMVEKGAKIPKGIVLFELE